MSSISKKRKIFFPIMEDAVKDLFEALQYGSDEDIKKALAAGADPNAKNTCGEPAVLIAVHNNRKSNLKILIDAGADVNSINKGGWAPLYEAVWSRDIETVRMLINAGADPNQRETGGWTPLMAMAAAAYYEETDNINKAIKIMLMLIEAGADAGIKDRNGDTAFNILQNRYPKFYNAYIEELKAALPEAKRLKREDSADCADTGYEFDI